MVVLAEEQRVVLEVDLKVDLVALKVELGDPVGDPLGDLVDVLEAQEGLDLLEDLMEPLCWLIALVLLLMY